ncbi:MAG: branched-chain amino acid ABC transporter permease [Candidatus Izemoplasmatales bacterium]
MNFFSELSMERKMKIKSILNHPYFGFFIITFLMFFVQILSFLGVNVPISVMRAFGLTMIYIIIALGFSILLGYAGLASLGTAGFVGVGTYILGYLSNTLHYGFISILVIAILIAILIGVIVGFISLRIEGMYLAIITLGLSEILNEIFKNATVYTNGTNGLGINTLYFFSHPIPLNDSTVFVFLSVMLFVMMVLTLNIIKSPTGRAMLAMRNSESAAQAMGVSVFKYRLLAFMISTVYAVLGGYIYMSYFAFSIPTSWSLSFSLNILAAVIVGGSQSIYGILLGTFMIFGLNLSVLQQISFFQNNPAISIVFNGVLIIVVIMFYPGGLVRLIQTLYYKLKKALHQLHEKWRLYKYGPDPE